jgi:ABC-2 type transport system permease protein
MFLLAGGGPPPDVMSPVMNDISTVLPLTHVVRAIQEPWLGLGNGTNHLIVVGAMFVVATLLTLARSGALGSFGSVLSSERAVGGFVTRR